LPHRIVAPRINVRSKNALVQTRHDVVLERVERAFLRLLAARCPQRVLQEHVLELAHCLLAARVSKPSENTESRTAVASGIK